MHSVLHETWAGTTLFHRWWGVECCEAAPIVVGSGLLFRPESIMLAGPPLPLPNGLARQIFGLPLSPEMTPLHRSYWN